MTFAGPPKECRIDLSSPRWWQTGIIYQVYPRSFADGNGDGVGDLPGLVNRLDYFEWLGVDIIWISPIYPSPMADFGYDISDYTDIHPLFGTLKDFDRLLDSAHQRGLKILLDLVPNHTSEAHPWFVDSRSSRANSKRDWYLWRDPAPDGGPPNNWLSNFGGSAWEWDARTEQYYYHAYLKEQPDLNWRNPKVQDAMHRVMRFWLDRGVDGFRVDVIWHLIKDDEFRPNPPNPDYRPGEWPYRQLLATYSTDRPEVHEVIGGMRAVMNEYDDRLMIGEIYLPIERLVTYYGTADRGCHLPFNFQLIEVPWQAPRIAATIDAYEAALPAHGWPNWVLGNHDKPRLMARLGPAQARVAAMLLLTLRGTPTLYYGDEIGMDAVPIPPDLVQDPWEKNVPGLSLGRDPSRTPMQWDASAHAGFTSGRPWLPLPADFKTSNVAVERTDPTSMLSLYRRLIGLRRAEPALHLGSYRRMQATDHTLTYVREAGDQQWLIALNFSPHQMTVDAPDFRAQGRIMLSTALDREDERLSHHIRLRPHEGIIARLSPTSDPG
jgi:alpha-glucosidase